MGTREALSGVVLLVVCAPRALVPPVSPLAPGGPSLRPLRPAEAGLAGGCGLPCYSRLPALRSANRTICWFTGWPAGLRATAHAQWAPGTVTVGRHLCSKSGLVCRLLESARRGWAAVGEALGVTLDVTGGDGFRWWGGFLLFGRGLGLGRFFLLFLAYVLPGAFQPVCYCPWNSRLRPEVIELWRWCA
jgi:hypothetical protein